MRATKSRIYAFDIAKGMTIILVVYGHCLRGLVAGNIISPASPILISDYVIYTFHMPVFFVISGFFLDRRSEKPAGTIWLARVRTIAYPYLLWSFVHGGLLYAASGLGATNNDISVSRILEIGWDPIAPYWFLYALFCAYLLTALAGQIRAEWLLAVAFVAFVLSFVLAPQIVADICYGFMYFAAGIVLRERQWLKNLPSSWPAIGLVWLLFAIATAVCYRFDVPERLPLASALFGIAATLATCFYLERRFKHSPITRMLEVFGQCSMGIFVLHIITLGAVRLILLRFVHLSDPVMLLTVGTVTGVLIPTAIQIVAIRLNVQNIIALPSSSRAFGVNRRFAWRQAGS